MKDITFILLAAGNSTRFGLEVKKQWIRVGDTPLWQFVANKFKPYFKDIIIVSNANDLEYMRSFDDGFKFVEGGSQREISLKNALSLVDTKWVLVSDAARAGISFEMIERLILNKDKFDCVSPYLEVVDTAYLGDDLINRHDIKLIQTPQVSRTSLLKKALMSGENDAKFSDAKFSDDSSAVKSVGGKLGFVKGDEKAFKITFKSDLKKALNEYKILKPPSKDFFVGNGFDTHKFTNGNGIMLCGIKVPCEYDFIAHSDGDVALHALSDALLGACGLGDIGELYPDNDEKFKDISSVILLKDILKKIKSYGYEVVNADIAIIAQSPKLGSFKKDMQKKVSEILAINRVNIKATTTEKLGFIGRNEGVSVMASVMVKYFDWTKA